MSRFLWFTVYFYVCRIHLVAAFLPSVFQLQLHSLQVSNTTEQVYIIIVILFTVCLKNLPLYCDYNFVISEPIFRIFLLQESLFSLQQNNI